MRSSAKVVLHDRDLHPRPNDASLLVHVAFFDLDGCDPLRLNCAPTWRERSRSSGCVICCHTQSATLPMNSPTSGTARVGMQEAASGPVMHMPKGAASKAVRNRSSLSRSDSSAACSRRTARCCGPRTRRTAAQCRSDSVGTLPPLQHLVPNLYR